MATQAKKSQAQSTKKQKIVELLREAILSGDLGPGDRLTQEELAARFNVSMTPVREAIQQLVAEGVLDQSPYKGVQVVEVSPEDATEIYLMRSVVEALATRIGVPNMRISDVQHIHLLHNQIREQTEKGDLSQLRKLNYEFHMLIYDAANMPRLYRLIQNLWAQSPWDTLYVIPNRPRHVVEEHTSIIAAIDQGNAQLAGQAMQAHIEAGMHMLVEYLSENDGS